MSDNYEIRDINGELIMDNMPLLLEPVSLEQKYATINFVDTKVGREEFNREIRKLRREMKRMSEGKYTYISNRRR